MSVQDATILRIVRVRLTPKGSWTQGVSARDSKGDSIPPESKYAVSFCLLGAVPLAHVDDLVRIFREAVGRHPADWNDTRGRTQAEVLAFLDARIAEAEVAP